MNTETQPSTLLAEPEIDLSYKYVRHFRKWSFQYGEHTVLLACNGRETADQVAKLMKASIKRTKKALCPTMMDGLTRAAIAKMDLM